VRDKTVRRRRAVLALLVALALILITASFGGSGGPLHTVQSGFLDVLSPIETGASKALTPVHDLIHWINDVANASSERDRYRKEVAQQEQEIVALQAQQHARSDSTKLHRLDSTLQLGGDAPVDASVIEQPEGLWVSHVTIDAGSGQGVHVNAPVIDPDGAIGVVTSVAADGAVVTLINDSSSGVAARDSSSREFGIVRPAPGDPGQLQMQDISRPSEISVGDIIVTAGERTTQNGSLFPANIPIGRVTSVDQAGDDASVQPAADLSSLDSVQVLTSVPGA
jgi:rod shape-determining protein MreC